MDFLTESLLAQLQFYLKNLPGKLGICLNNSVPEHILNSSTIQFFYYTNPQNGNKTTSTLPHVYGNDDLALLTDSVDVCVLWHNLDHNFHCNELMNEIWRVLTPNGVALIVGANNPCIFKLPTNEKLNSRLSLLKSLNRVGFEIEVQKTFGFRPLDNKHNWLTWLKPLEIVGQFCWPMSGSCYFILARKTIFAGTRVLANEKRFRFKKIRGLAEPSTYKNLEHWD